MIVPDWSARPIVMLVAPFVIAVLKSDWANWIVPAPPATPIVVPAASAWRRMAPVVVMLLAPPVEPMPLAVIVMSPPAGAVPVAAVTVPSVMAVELVRLIALPSVVLALTVPVKALPASSRTSVPARAVRLTAPAEASCVIAPVWAMLPALTMKPPVPSVEARNVMPSKSPRSTFAAVPVVSMVTVSKSLEVEKRSMLPPVDVIDVLPATATGPVWATPLARIVRLPVMAMVARLSWAVLVSMIVTLLASPATMLTPPAKALAGLLRMMLAAVPLAVKVATPVTSRPRAGLATWVMLPVLAVAAYVPVAVDGPSSRLVES